jgi:hypothetical protein
MVVLGDLERSSATEWLLPGHPRGPRRQTLSASPVSVRPAQPAGAFDRSYAASKTIDHDDDGGLFHDLRSIGSAIVHGAETAATNVSRAAGGASALGETSLHRTAALLEGLEDQDWSRIAWQSVSVISTTSGVVAEGAGLVAITGLPVISEAAAGVAFSAALVHIGADVALTVHERTASSAVTAAEDVVLLLGGRTLEKKLVKRFEKGSVRRIVFSLDTVVSASVIVIDVDQQPHRMRPPSAPRWEKATISP